MNWLSKLQTFTWLSSDEMKVSKIVNTEKLVLRKGDESGSKDVLRDSNAGT